MADAVTTTFPLVQRQRVRIGRAALERAPDPLQDQYVRQFDALPDWEQAMIIAGLERVASLLNADRLDAAPVLDLGDIKNNPG